MFLGDHDKSDLVGHLLRQTQEEREAMEMDLGPRDKLPPPIKYNGSCGKTSIEKKRGISYEQFKAVKQKIVQEFESTVSGCFFSTKSSL